MADWTPLTSAPSPPGHPERDVVRRESTATAADDVTRSPPPPPEPIDFRAGLDLADMPAARVEFTARVLASATFDFATLMLDPENARLLRLDAVIADGQTILSRLLSRRATHGLVYTAAWKNLEEFGYVFPPQDDLILSLATRMSQLGDVNPTLLRIGELLLAQPSCTSEQVMRRSQYHAWWSFLLEKPRLELLPFAVELQKRSSPPVPWSDWLEGLEWYTSAPRIVEFALRFLLDTNVEAAAPVGEKVLAARLEDAVSCSDYAPLCTHTRIIFELTTKLAAHSRLCVADAVVTDSVAASSAELRRWMEQQLTDLPTTFLSVTLRSQLAASCFRPAGGVEALVAALQERPHCVRLDEVNAEAESIVRLLLWIDHPRVCLLEPAIEQIIERVAAMDPRAMHLHDGEQRPTAADFLLGENALRLTAIARPQGGPFDRLHRALVEAAVKGLPEDASTRAATVWQWFSHCGTCQWKSPASVAGVRRTIELLALSGVPTLPDVAQALFTSDERLRSWLLLHEGSDWCVAASLARSVQTRDRDDAGNVEWRGEMEARWQTWQTALWPNMARDLEQHLIRDLAAEVLTFLRP